MFCAAFTRHMGGAKVDWLLLVDVCSYTNTSPQVNHAHTQRDTWVVNGFSCDTDMQHTQDRLPVREPTGGAGDWPMLVAGIQECVGFQLD